MPFSTWCIEHPTYLEGVVTNTNTSASMAASGESACKGLKLPQTPVSHVPHGPRQ